VLFFISVLHGRSILGYRKILVRYDTESLISEEKHIHFVRQIVVNLTKSPSNKVTYLLFHKHLVNPNFKFDKDAIENLERRESKRSGRLSELIKVYAIIYYYSLMKLFLWEPFGRLLMRHESSLDAACNST